MCFGRRWGLIAIRLNFRLWALNITEAGLQLRAGMACFTSPPRDIGSFSKFLSAKRYA